MTDGARPSGGRRHVTAATALLAIAIGLAACAGDDGAVSPTAPADGPVVVTFQVAGDETYRILLTDPADIDIARRLLAGEDAPSIPNGLVVRGETGVNEGYSWSLDPADFEWADLTIEVCDGVPSDVESGAITSERYCPWSAVVVEVVAAP